MKLHHTVNHTPNERIARSIEVFGIAPHVADEYKDLVPEEIRHLPVVWLSEGIWQSKELPVFEVDSADLDKNKLYPNNIKYPSTDEKLGWWLYQGHIPSNILTRLTTKEGGA